VGVTPCPSPKLHWHCQVLGAFNSAPHFTSWLPIPGLMLLSQSPGLSPKRCFRPESLHVGLPGKLPRCCDEADYAREAVAAKEWVCLGEEQCLVLDGPDRLLGQFTKSFLETALSKERSSTLVMRRTVCPMGATTRTCATDLAPKR